MTKNKKQKLNWEQKCPKCNDASIPQQGYPRHFYCFKGGHGMFEIVKELNKANYKFRYDGEKI